MTRRDPVPRRLAPRPVARPWGGSGVAAFGLPAVGEGVPTGEWWVEAEDFPLLVKVIDARENLSIQVHPGDEQARAEGAERGKTEAWLVLAATPDARIWLGVRPDVAPGDLFAAAAGGRDVAHLLESFAPRAGDLVFVPAGTIHAIGAGVLLLEVQQRSDVTYRIHDWGRVPARPIHLEQAARALLHVPGAGRKESAALHTPWFDIDALALARGEEVAAGAGELFFCAGGAGRVDAVGATAPFDVEAGSFVLVPERSRARIVAAADGMRVARVRGPG